MAELLRVLSRFLDATLGKWARHFCFVVLRNFFSLFYNVSCSNKHLLQDLPGGLILATHVSRLDGPLIIAMLYSTRRVRPAAHYNEVYNPMQWLPMKLINAVPMSSPKSWSAEKRAAQKENSLETLGQTIDDGGFVLLFPAGYTKRTPRETIEPHFSGAYETLKAVPESPVLIVRLNGIGRFDKPKHDLFWSWIGITKGRRHINMSIELLDGGLDTSVGLEEFNADLEERLNAPSGWPMVEGATTQKVDPT